MTNRINVELRNVRKQYGDFVAVDGLSIAVPRGTIFGLLGPNGAGKTTSIRMMMDIIAPDSGEVLLFGEPHASAHMRRVGYLPEERGLYRKMTVVDHLAFLGELHGLKRRDSKDSIDRWLDRIELAPWRKSKVEELSKGMQQKIQLVGTLLHEPEIIVLDEPFAGLDPLNQSLFKDLLAEYKESGRTILFSTHIMAQAEKLCDSICLVSKGNSILQGTISEVKSGFGGNCYRLEAQGDTDRLLQVAGVEQAVPYGEAFHLFIEPGADVPTVLRELTGFLDVREFSSEEPDLEEVFIRAVRDAA